MFSTNFLSTSFWIFLASLRHFSSAALAASTFLVVPSEACFSWSFVNLDALLKNLSSTFAPTPSTETVVDVLITYAGFTLFKGTPLIQWGPVTNKFPDSKAFKTTTLLPLWAPANRITICPGLIDWGQTGFLGWHLLLLKLFFSSSAGYQVFSLFFNLDFWAPPRTRDKKN